MIDNDPKKDWLFDEKPAEGLKVEKAEKYKKRMAESEVRKKEVDKKKKKEKPKVNKIL